MNGATLWYLARATGFSALLLSTLSICLGALATRAPAATDALRDRRVLRQLAHRSAAVLAVAVLAAHVVLILLDTFVSVSLPGVLVPFTAGYRGFALGLGTLAAYGLLVLVATGLLRGRLARSATAARRWRTVHAGAYLVWVLSMGHGLLAGTDTGRWWSWALYVGCAAAVGGALVVRLTRASARRADRHAPRTAPALAAARRQLIPGGTR